MFRVVSVFGFAFLTVAVVALTKAPPRTRKESTEEPACDQEQTQKLALLARPHRPMYYAPFSVN
jgi:hypothetical protein